MLWTLAAARVAVGTKSLLRYRFVRDRAHPAASREFVRPCAFELMVFLSWLTVDSFLAMSRERLVSGLRTLRGLFKFQSHRSHRAFGSTGSRMVRGKLPRLLLLLPSSRDPPRCNTLSRTAAELTRRPKLPANQQRAESTAKPLCLQVQ